MLIHFVIAVINRRTTFSVDGEVLFDFVDPSPSRGGGLLVRGMGWWVSGLGRGVLVNQALSLRFGICLSVICSCKEEVVS